MFKESVEVVQNIHLFEKTQSKRGITHFFLLLEISSQSAKDAA